MSTYEADRTSRFRAPRLWIVETLVVLGVLAFGYFALTVDAARLTPAAVEAIDPVTEFIR
jgi:hypothetical protein